MEIYFLFFMMLEDLSMLHSAPRERETELLQIRHRHVVNQEARMAILAT